MDELTALTQPGREEDLRRFLLLLHPADVADLLEEVSESTAVAILRHLDPERAAEMLSELEPADAEMFLRRIAPQELGSIVGEMETDDAADFIQELDEETRRRILSHLPEDDREDVEQLLAYSPDTAGGLMQTELVAVPIDATVADTLTAVREAADEVDIISVFVIDHGGHYAGNLALQELVLSPGERPVEQVMEPKVVEVNPELDQEEVARLFDHYSLVELGVVDADGKLIGRITADDVHEVLVEEAEEDMLKLAGTAAEPDIIYSDKVLQIVGQRLPWLISTFMASMVCAWILESSKVVFGTAVILLTFVPVITGMSGNVGTQSAMIMIQGMASGHVDQDSLLKNVVKDIMVAAVMAAVCGTAVTVIIAIWQGQSLLGLCVGVALMCSMITASVLGSTEPALLKRFGVDPAIAAGPLITSMNDVSGVVIYTGVSLLFLDYLG